METHQIHFGRKFNLDKKTGYWLSTDYPRIRAHCWVWVNYHGTIPKGYHIHHKDEDKSNNSIENLALLSPSAHVTLHYKTNPTKGERAAENLNNIRHLTKEWHASEEGKAWHKFHALKNGFGKREPKNYICAQCSLPFTSKNVENVRFCSNKCKSKWRRTQGLDDIERDCAVCRTKFKVNKYSKIATCNRSCSAKKRWKERKIKSLLP